MKNIKFIEFMLFGSGPKSFARNGTLESEKYYYSEFKKSNFTPILKEYSIDRKKYKGFKKLIFIVIKFIHSIFDQFRILFFQNDFQYIRCKQIYGSWSGLFLKILSRKKLFIRIGYSWSQSVLYENGINSKKYMITKFIENFLLKKADGLIVSSKYLYKKYYGFCNEIIVVPNGINTNYFKSKNQIRKFDYIYVGRLINIKGVDRLIDFIKLNKNKKFLIIGANPLSINFKQYKNVKYFSRIENYKLPEYLNDSENFLNLSRSEGSPKGLIEAIACGCFPIVSNIEAHVDLLADLKYGKIINYPKKNVITIGDYQKQYLVAFCKKYCIKNCVSKEIEFIRKKIIN